jgi:hypothetical protein
MPPPPSLREAFARKALKIQYGNYDGLAVQDLRHLLPSPSNHRSPSPSIKSITIVFARKFFVIILYKERTLFDFPQYSPFGISLKICVRF